MNERSAEQAAEHGDESGGVEVGLRFRILGSLQVLDDGGVEIDVGGSKPQLLLVQLLLDPNRVVSSEALIDALWGDNPPPSARRSLQAHVAKLRAALGGDAGPVKSHPPGYVLASSSIDALQFEALISRGREELANDPHEAAATLRTALGLWRGEPFSGFDDGGALLTERARLEELQLLALQDRIGADLVLGRHREIAAELEALSRAHPYREGFRAQHMLALYRSGRQAEALRAFQRTRAVLVEELGLEPSPLLRQLEEQVLLQDPALDLPSMAEESFDPSGPVNNPYMGLRAFTEADADLFYGRDELIAELASIVAGDAGLTAVVGPSGSGKSSLVQAGLIAALRGAKFVDASWVIAVMRPGAYPFVEFEAALARAVDEPPVTMSLLWNDDSDLLRAVLRVLPDDGSQLLLVIDQFEELFTLVDDEQRNGFLRGLIALATDPRGRSRVVVTLRADFYDRPLMHPAFGRLMTGHVVNVMPLAADELEAAALGPASGVGVAFERGLLAALIDEVSGQPHALPLFQYTLTELFDHRQGSMLTRAAYAALGGIRGAVASRAEAIYEALELDQQEAARQLFLRLVTVGRDSETRRVVAASELVTLDVDTVTMQAALEAFVANRLLVRDRDAVSGALTVEVAHEALLSEWVRLRRWIDDGRDELRHHAAYLLVVEEWLTAGRDPDYLLTGGRLVQFDQWRTTTTMRLTALENEFLDEALRRRDEAVAAETARGAEHARLRGRARRRAFALGAGVAAIVAAATIAIVATSGTGNTAHIAVIAANDLADDPLGALYEQGFVRAERDLDVDVDRRALPSSPQPLIAELAADDTELVILDPLAAHAIDPDSLDPNTRYLLTNYERIKFDGFPNVTRHHWADEQAGYLAGVAAATTTETGIVGFLGAIQTRSQEEYRAGFEAGAQSIEPDIRILATYLSDYGYQEPYDSPDGARSVADLLYADGADVIFHTAGRSGDGVLDAATALRPNKVWAIGDETDQWQPATTRQRPHILTSIIKRFDEQMYRTIEDHLGGDLDPGVHRLTAADGVFTYATSGNALSAEAGASLDRTLQHLASGEVQVPRNPTGQLIEPDSRFEPGRSTSYFAGGESVPVTFTLPAGWEVYDIFVNHKSESDELSSVSVSFWDVEDVYADPCQWVLIDPPVGPTVADLVTAWANLPGFDATRPRNITVDGHEGIRIDLTLPLYNEDECIEGKFGLWQEDGPLGEGRDPNRWAQSPAQHLQQWILDVDGTRLVISASYLPDTSQQDRADLNEIINSIQIG